MTGFRGITNLPETKLDNYYSAILTLKILIKFYSITIFVNNIINVHCFTLQNLTNFAIKNVLIVYGGVYNR